MNDGIEITGGAGDFEAAVIAVVLDHIAESERAAREGRTKADSLLPLWIQALRTDEDEPVPGLRRFLQPDPPRRNSASSGDFNT